MALVSGRLLASELHRLRSGFAPHLMRSLGDDAPQEWQDRMEGRMFHFTMVIDRLDTIIGLAHANNVGDRLLLAEALDEIASVADQPRPGNVQPL